MRPERILAEILMVPQSVGSQSALIAGKMGALRFFHPIDRGTNEIFDEGLVQGVTDYEKIAFVSNKYNIFNDFFIAIRLRNISHQKRY